MRKTLPPPPAPVSPERLDGRGQDNIMEGLGFHGLRIKTMERVIAAGKGIHTDAWASVSSFQF